MAVFWFDSHLQTYINSAVLECIVTIAFLYGIVKNHGIRKFGCLKHHVILYVCLVLMLRSFPLVVNSVIINYSEFIL